MSHSYFYISLFNTVLYALCMYVVVDVFHQMQYLLYNLFPSYSNQAIFRVFYQSYYLLNLLHKINGHEIASFTNRIHGLHVTTTEDS
jgi:hypothetical protein